MTDPDVPARSVGAATGTWERVVRVLLVLVGAAVGGYGGLLLWPLLGVAGWWLLAGPVLHDAVVAPLVGLVGLALGRLLSATARRWVRFGLAVTGTLLLIAVPLLWRPAAAPPNPGLQDRDYLTGLAVWLAALWVGVALALVLSRRGPRAGAVPPARSGTPANS